MSNQDIYRNKQSQLAPRDRFAAIWDRLQTGIQLPEDIMLVSGNSQQRLRGTNRVQQSRIIECMVQGRVIVQITEDKAIFAESDSRVDTDLMLLEVLTAPDDTPVYAPRV